jgi:hypothetical protein
VPLKRHQRRHVWSNDEWGEELKLSYLKFSIRTKRTIIIKYRNPRKTKNNVFEAFGFAKFG